MTKIILEIIDNNVGAVKIMGILKTHKINLIIQMTILIVGKRGEGPNPQICRPKQSQQKEGIAEEEWLLLLKPKAKMAKKII